ncbi:GNAT family N-acetyltransferase [Streptomyces sp. R-74717]|uniref:hypothetical protein n=1 Tax=Streptomyces TaxID=1883 RepID=UPI00378C0577
MTQPAPHPARLRLDAALDGLAVTFRGMTAGFREEGRRRAAVLVAGKRYGTVLFGLLREEWPGATS